MSIGNRIKCLRKQQNLNQTELGEMLGLNFGAISAMESDRSMPRTETVLKICEIFKVSPDYLLLGKETEQTISENEQEMLEVLRTDTEITNAVMGIAKLKKKAVSYMKNYSQQEQRAVMG